MMKKYLTSNQITILSAFLTVLLFLGLMVGVSGAASFSRTRMLMGTLVKITVETDNKTNANAAIDRAFEEMVLIDASMSSYKENSEVALISRQAGKSPVRISPMLLEVLEASRYYHLESNGAFDVTAGPLVRLWGFMGGEKRVPRKEEISDALSRVGSEKIVLAPASGTVYLPSGGMEVDLGGIAKGYAADRAARVLKRAGIARGIVDAGGNLLVFGYPKGKGIPVGIRHPVNNEDLFGWLEVGEGAVATSGSYENFFLHNGRRYAHIIDPRTGRPVEGILSVTVRAPTAMEADALSTALFVMGPKEGTKLAGRLKNIDFLMIHTKEKEERFTVTATPGFGLHRSAPPE